MTPQSLGFAVNGDADATDGARRPTCPGGSPRPSGPAAVIRSTRTETVDELPDDRTTPPTDDAWDLHAEIEQAARCTGRAVPAGLRDSRGDRPGWHGGRVQGTADPPRPPGRPEDGAGRRPRLARAARAVLHRVAGCRPAPASGDRPDPRGGRARRTPLFLARVRRRRQPREEDRRQAAAAARGRRDGARPRHRHRRGAPPQHHPPRPEAGQCAPDPRRPAQDHRLRPGEAIGRRLATDPDRRDHGHAKLHGSRAGLGPDPPDRPARPTSTPWARSSTRCSSAARRSREPRPSRRSSWPGPRNRCPRPGSSRRSPSTSRRSA